MALFDPSCWVSRGLSRDQFHFLSLLLCWTTALVYLRDRATEYRNAGVINSVWRFRVLNGGSGFSTRPNSNRQIPSTAKSNSPQTKPYNVWVPARIPGAPVLHPFLHTCSWAFLPLVLIISHVATNQQRRALSSCNLRPRAVSLLRGFVHTLTKILSTDTKCGRRLAVAGVAAGRLLLLLSGCNFIDRFHAHRLVID